MQVRLFGTWYGPEDEYVVAECTDLMSFSPDEKMMFGKGSCRLRFHNIDTSDWAPRIYMFDLAELWLTVEICRIADFAAELGPLANINFVKELLMEEGWINISDSFTVREEEFIHAGRVASEVLY